jgi:hypothetical protein
MTATTPDSKEFSKRQILFTRYYTAILIDLTVLNLFNEYSDNVQINSFTISLLAAIVLQLMLQITFKIEHGVGSHFLKKGRKGMRIFSAWALLFGSKFAILWVLEVFFGDQIMFLGAFHGIVTFIMVILTMLAAEALIRWITLSVLGID